MTPVRLSFIQLSGFRTNWARMKLTDEDLRRLESLILAAPDAAPVMRGTGGLRKVRLAPASSSGGKSGGARVCYAYFADFRLVYLCAVFAKNDKANLPPHGTRRLPQRAGRVRPLPAGELAERMAP